MISLCIDIGINLHVSNIGSGGNKSLLNEMAQNYHFIPYYMSDVFGIPHGDSI